MNEYELSPEQQQKVLTGFDPNKTFTDQEIRDYLEGLPNIKKKSEVSKEPVDHGEPMGTNKVNTPANTGAPKADANGFELFTNDLTQQEINDNLMEPNSSFKKGGNTYYHSYDPLSQFTKHSIIMKNDFDQNMAASNKLEGTREDGQITNEQLTALKAKYPDVREGSLAYPETFRALKKKGYSDNEASIAIQALLHTAEKSSLENLNTPAFKNGKPLTDQFTLSNIDYLNQINWLEKHRIDVSNGTPWVEPNGYASK